MYTAVEIVNEHEWNTLQAIEVHKGKTWTDGGLSHPYDSSAKYMVIDDSDGMYWGDCRQSNYNMLTFDAYMASNFNPATDNEEEISVCTPDDVSWFTTQLIENARGLRWSSGDKIISSRHKYIYISYCLLHGDSISSTALSFKDYLSLRITNNPIKRNIPYDSVLPGNAENWQTVEAVECLKGRKWGGGENRIVFQESGKCIRLSGGDMSYGSVGSYKKTMSMKQYLNYNKAYIKQLEEIEASKPTVGTPERAIFDVQDVFPEHLRLSKDLQIKPVVFDLKNELSSDYELGSMCFTVSDILHGLIKDNCPLLRNTYIPNGKLRDKFYYAFKENIKDDFFQNYYTEGGAKITKRLKGIVKGVIGKKLTDHIFPVFCNKLSALYAKQETIVAFFGDKKNLGEGLFENGATCFRRNKGSRGENAINGVFLDKNKRFQMLCLYSLEKQAFARVVVHFVGGRKVDMFNFYYQEGFKQNKRLFVEAYRRLFNLKKVSFVPGKTVNVPIYCNDDHLIVSTDRTHESTHRHKWACPHCEGKAHPKDFHTRQRDYWRDLGCKESCLKLEAGKECCVCEETISDNYTDNDGDVYCEDCYNDRYFNCYDCDSEVKVDDAIEVGGYYYCKNCASSCKECGDYCLNNELEDGLCSDCYSDKYGTCEECDCEMERDGLSADGNCEDCQTKLDEEEEKENEAA